MHDRRARAPGAARRPAAGARQRASSSFTTSRSCGSPTATSPASRRCCAGTTPSAGSSSPVDFIPFAEETRADRPDRPLGAARGVPAGGGRCSSCGPAIAAALRSASTCPSGSCTTATSIADVRDALEGSGLDPEPADARDHRVGDDRATPSSRSVSSRSCARSACAWRWTISAPATRRSATSAASRSTSSRWTARSCGPAPRRRPPASPPRCSRLGETFALDVVAEGIEFDDQLSRLRDLGCELGQGFYFAQPDGAGAPDRYLAEQARAATDGAFRRAAAMQQVTSAGPAGGFSRAELFAPLAQPRLPAAVRRSLRVAARRRRVPGGAGVAGLHALERPDGARRCSESR